MLVGPEISLFKCNKVSSSGIYKYEEEGLEGRWFELVFKAGEDLADESNVDISSSWWVEHLKREE